MRPRILFFISLKPNEAPFVVHFKHKNVVILILTSKQKNEATFLLLKSEKKANEGHLKQMREGLGNDLFLCLALQTAT